MGTYVDFVLINIMLNESRFLEEGSVASLAVASLLQRDDCVEDRLRAAFETGATKAEVTETLMIVALQSAEAQLLRKSDLYRKYLEGSNNQVS